ncbi:MAG: hypothetical protein GY841_06220 [FCB group bacterium]|nr:hypothetical protein [FCB group bacterium]
MKKIAVLIAMLPVTAFLLAGCEEATTQPDPVDTYRVEAILVKYLTDQSARLDLSLLKNGELYKNADIKLDAFNLDTGLTGYFLVFGSGILGSDSSYTLSIEDSTLLDVNLTINLPGDLTAEVTDLPASRIYSGGSVNVDWTVSSGTEGYILATVPPDTIAADSGYEAYVSGTSGAITPEALNFNQLLMRGHHKVLLMAYTGAPSEATAVPFEIPTANNPEDSVFSTRLSGRIAGMVVAIPDSIIVPSQ